MRSVLEFSPDACVTMMQVRCALRILGGRQAEFETQIDHRYHFQIDDAFDMIGRLRKAVISCTPISSRTVRTRMPNSSLPS
jgi:hypothetical protein